LTKKNQIHINFIQFNQGSLFDINNIHIIVKRRIFYMIIIICKPTKNEPFSCHWSLWQFSRASKSSRFSLPNFPSHQNPDMCAPWRGPSCGWQPPTQRLGTGQDPPGQKIYIFFLTLKEVGRQAHPVWRPGTSRVAPWRFPGGVCPPPRTACVNIIFFTADNCAIQKFPCKP